MLAGGTGSRMGRPKQFIDLLGRPALYHTLRAFEEAPGIDRIYTVGDAARIGELAAMSGISKYSGCASPGESRSLSTRSGLGLCAEDPESVVLIHDGSRCLVTPELIQRVIEAAHGDADGVIPTLPVSDTIKVAENGAVMETLDRSRLHATQTPQAFRLGLLRRIYAASEEFLLTATDDASLVERAGGCVAIVHGDKTNIKLTSPEDLILAEAILTSRSRLHNGDGAHRGILWRTRH
ncbi:MAG TPA: 2-C-methyl-D-erythritol 4-phosphate cytidylyltransferase [Rubrobacteraceae bacterium]|nr:2-C-methyl-D-erythritol 4-phosphate cytidylyltransferase [Rubrobacteraceae bacterium]